MSRYHDTKTLARFKLKGIPKFSIQFAHEVEHLSNKNFKWFVCKNIKYENQIFLSQFIPPACHKIYNRHRLPWPGRIDNLNYLKITYFSNLQPIGFRDCPTDDPIDNPSYFPFPYDCKKFIICTNGVPVVECCPEGTVWNQNLEVCDHDIECVILTTQFAK